MAENWEIFATDSQSQVAVSGRPLGGAEARRALLVDDFAGIRQT
jgi:hypothetical protein